MTIAALLVAALLMVAPQAPQVESIQFRDIGHITFDTSVASDVKVQRLYDVTEFVLQFVEDRCGGCVLDTSMLQLEVYIQPYAQYEDQLLDSLDMHQPELAELIRGDQGLIDGHTQLSPFQPPVMYYYQEPSDPLYIHELLHVLFPQDPEQVIQQRQLAILGSRDYKDWLRNNY